MKVYFVRHGESVANQRLEEQSSDELTPRGLKQAEQLGTRLQQEGITRIFTSPMRRTRETAAAIETALNVPLETLDFLREVVFPDNIDNVPPADRLPLIPGRWMAEHASDPAYRIGGSESFENVVTRVRRLQKYLIKQAPGQNVLVVGHGQFLRFFLGSVLFADEFGPAQYGLRWRTVSTSNTGISVFEYLEEPGTYGRPANYWRLVTWMDHSHL